MTEDASAWGVEATPVDEQVAAFARVIGWRHDAVPPTWPICLLPDTGAVAELAAQCERDSRLPVHAVQSFRYSRPVEPGRPLKGEVKLAMRPARATIRLALADGAGPVCEASSTIVLAERLPARPSAAAKDTTPGLATLETPAIDVPLFRAYQDASGDNNPIHHDAGAAACLGLAAPIAPGMLVLGMMSAFAADVLECPSPSAIDAMFLAPVLAGTALSFRLHPPASTGRYKLTAEAPDGVTCVQATLTA
jgi:acyl dehydratase